MAGGEQLKVLNLKKFLHFLLECCKSHFSEVLVLQAQVGQQGKDIPARTALGAAFEISV